MARFRRRATRYKPTIQSHPGRSNIGAICIRVLDLLFPSLKRALLNILVAGSCSILLWLLIFSSSSPTANLIVPGQGGNNRPAPPHPIPQLIKDGLEKWEKIVGSQSTSYEQAVETYKRRYKLDPPPGFDKWFSYCFTNKVQLVDEYDELMRTLEPFRKMGSKEMRRRAAAAMWGFYDTNAIVLNKTGLHLAGRDEIRVERSEGIIRYLRDNKVVDILKEVVTEEWMIPVNELAEPRVLNKMDLSTVKFQPRNKNGGTTISKIWDHHQYGEGSLIEAIKETCGSSPFTEGQRVPNWTPDSDIKTTSYAKAFVTDLWKDLDVCQSPDMPKAHSFFRTRHTTTKGLIPMLGFGRPSVFGEILVPTHYWWGNPDYTIDPKKDIEFSAKKPLLYWHGSSTGGGHGDPTLSSMHRHRLLRFFSQPTSPPRPLPLTTFNPTTSRPLTLYTPPSPLNPFANTTHFTFVLPDPKDCTFFDCPTISSFPTAPHTPLNTHTWSHRLLADLDGWGYSARFRALMKSNSAVLKSTAMIEWWTDRIVPWVHYIPVSIHGNDWGDLISFFLGTPPSATENPSGNGTHTSVATTLQTQLAREIADRGREWAYENTRSQDMTAYTLRVFLELNRLFTGNYLATDSAENVLRAEEDKKDEARIRKEAELWVRNTIKEEHGHLLEMLKDKLKGEAGEKEVAAEMERRVEEEVVKRVEAARTVERDVREKQEVRRVVAYLQGLKKKKTN